MPKQLIEPEAVHIAASDYMVSGEPKDLQRYEAALREWLFPPRVGSWEWNQAQRRKRRRDDEGSAPLPCSPPPMPLTPSDAATVRPLMAAE